MPAVITGTGVAVPPNVVTNDDLTRIMDTTDEWIRSRTGVVSRRFGRPLGRSPLPRARRNPGGVSALGLPMRLAAAVSISRRALEAA